ncbi:MAG: polyribonucleotide nucleotidyltransferase [Saprospiraceae bacterium]
MGSIKPISVSFDLPSGEQVTIETGKLATQAHGSCVIKVGKMMMFASVVSAQEAREGQPFFPLSVDYQEKYASNGRIPGNFFRREARLNDYEILISRLVDRAIRPLFPDGYMNETQVIINMISADETIAPDAYAALAASTALVISNIPWAGPLSEARVAKIDGQYVVNPPRADLSKASMNLIVAATLDNVMMVEGDADECQESEIIEGIKVAHEAIKTQCNIQLELAKLVGDKALIKRVREVVEVDEDLLDYITKECKAGILEIAAGELDKEDRKNGFSKVKDALKEKILDEKGEEYVQEKGGNVSKYFDKLKKSTIRGMMLKEQKRLDGRKFDEIRNIWTEVDYLPSAHGSAIFTRGETQSLTSVTIGSKLDNVLVDTALDTSSDNFILHYNFPAFSVGESKPMRGPGRREVGHANLAGRSIRKVMPEGGGYTIRIVSDILESNGSSSMATVCAGSLALMDAGIQLKHPISGIAMGMVAEGNDVAILSDILGDEDALGDMDFKITGTQNGICGCQMDIKIDGLPYETLEKALIQAKDGRIHILNEMAKTLAQANADMKDHAPRVSEFRIDKSFIGAVIGPGGKIIQEIQEVTGVRISIEEKDNQGVVNIFASDKKSLEAAKSWIEKITFMPSVGDEVDATVASIMPYGMFVDFNGKSGLVHISEISHSRIEKMDGLFNEGDSVRVKIVGVDERSGKLRLSRKALLPRSDSND